MFVSYLAFVFAVLGVSRLMRPAVAKVEPGLRRTSDPASIPSL
jgi:hypothetical protein